MERLSKVLAACGIASRRECEKIIYDGRVTVNGEVVNIPQTRVHLKTDHVLVDGKKVQKEPKKIYYVLNKPLGYICTATIKKQGAKRVLDLFSHLPYRLFTVGRLDQNTTGLILVTNDGKFANQLIHPSFNHTKEYLVKTDQEITHTHLLALSKGMRIQNVFVKPVLVKKVRRGTLKIVISEGKKHEVRKLLEQAALTVRELVRIRLGSFLLGRLKEGEYRALNNQELEPYLL